MWIKICIKLENVVDYTHSNRDNSAINNTNDSGSLCHIYIKMNNVCQYWDITLNQCTSLSRLWQAARLPCSWGLSLYVISISSLISQCTLCRLPAVDQSTGHSKPAVAPRCCTSCGRGCSMETAIFSQLERIVGRSGRTGSDFCFWDQRSCLWMQTEMKEMC